VWSRLDQYECIWFTDLSLREEDFFSRLRQAGKEYYWFDHHVSSRPQDFFRVCIIDTSGEHCTAEIIQAYLQQHRYEIPPPLQTLVEYAHDQDLWVRRLPPAQDFNDILGTMPAPDLFTLLQEDLNRVFHWTEEMHRACAQTQQQRAKSLALAWATCVEHDLGAGLRLRLALCYGSANEVGEALGNEETLVVLCDLRDWVHLQPKFHLRTKSERINASHLAERLGGGGHPRASGAPLEREILRQISELLLDKVLPVAREALPDTKDPG